MNTVHRIYVGNLPQAVSQEDISKLFNKICPVTEVYVPGATPTGIHRGFAIINVNGDRSSITKCARTLNNSHWKGSVLRVEPAKEFYADKLQREKNMPDPPPRRPAPSIDHPPHHPPDILRIKRRRGHVVHIALDGDNVKDEKCLHMRKVRRFIDGVLEPDSTPLRPLHVIESAPRPAVVPTQIATAKPEIKAPSIPSGGGSRVGFGAVSQATISISAASNPILRDTYSADLLAPIEEDAPCVDSSEVTDEALERERQRVQSILNAVLAMPEPVAKPLKPKKTADVAAETKSIVAMDADTTFTNLTELKGIFHKEGGIAFGDVGGDAVVSNEFQNDVLFKEAELMGFDIRKDEDGANAMKFSFFEDETPVAPTPLAVAVPETVVPKVRPEIAKKTQKKSPVLATFGDIIRNALRFRRHKTEAEVISDWKTNREKLMVDYKRKKKQARKKAEQSKHGKR